MNMIVLNHVGDIGEYWVALHYYIKNLEPQLSKGKNASYDIKIKTGKQISVKTISDWNKTGYGTQIKPRNCSYRTD